MNRAGKILLTAIVVLAMALFNFFDAEPPLTLQFPSLGTGSMQAEQDYARYFRVEVELVRSDGINTPVQSALVRVGQLAALTNRNGVAEFNIPKGVYTVVISSLTSSMPIWNQEIKINALETVLRIKYHEYRETLTSLSVSLDHINGRSTVLVGYRPPPINTTLIHVGNPVIHYVDQSLYMRAFKGEGVQDWYKALNTQYRGPFKIISYNPESAEVTDRVDVEGLVLYISLAESYIPIFTVEAEIVEKN